MDRHFYLKEQLMDKPQVFIFAYFMDIFLKLNRVTLSPLLVIKFKFSSENQNFGKLVFPKDFFNEISGKINGM